MDYAWTPTATVENADSAKTRAYPTTKTEYVLQVTGADNCTETDTMVVFITVLPEDTASTSDVYVYIENKGQLVDMDRNPVSDFTHYNNRGNPNIYLKESAWSFVLSSFGSDSSYVQRIDVTPVNANKRSAITLDTTVEVFNYFLPHCPDGITGVKGYSYAVYPEIFDGIDLFFLSNRYWYKLYYVVKPGGDPEDIVMKFSGVDTITTVYSDSSLAFVSPAGVLVQPRMDSYSMDSTGAMNALSWKPTYTVSVNGDTVSLSDIGSYDTTKNLVFELDIDVEEVSAPSLYNNVWSTYIGTSGVAEMGKDVETDTEGNLYHVGAVSTNQLPPVVGITVIEPNFQSSFFLGSQGVRDAYISKFSWNGVRLISTYYGGFFDDIGTDVEIDATNGKLIMYGESLSDDYPTTIDAYQPFNANAPLVDRVLTAFNLELNQRYWSTYFGGTDEEFGNVEGEQMVLDDNSNIYVASFTQSTDIQTVAMSGAYNQTDPGWTVLAQFNNNGEALWVSYFPVSMGSIGYSEDQPYVVGLVSIDPDVTTCGVPTSGGFPLCDIGGYYQDYRSGALVEGGVDGFISAFSHNNELIWSTYVGGVVLHDIDIHGRFIYVVGSATIDGDPSTSTSPCSEPGVGYSIACEGTAGSGTEFNLTNQGYSDMFFGSFSEVDYTLKWATQYGGEGYESATHVAVDAGGRIFVGGSSNHSTFPTVPYGNNYYYESEASDNSGVNADSDPVLLMLAGNSVLWSTFYGGGNEVTPVFGWGGEYLMGMTTFEDSRMYITGMTSSPSFPYRCGDASVPNQYCRQIYQSGDLSDGFITLFRTDGSNTLSVQEIGAFEEKGSKCVVYPNPTTGRLTFDLESEEPTDLMIRILDMTGRTVDTEQQRNKSGRFSFEMDVRALDNGIYAIEITSSGKYRWICKFVKQ